MSVNMDMNESVDYSDFQYEQLHVEPKVNADSNVSFLYEYDPLEQIGGLKNNEVAELAFLELQIAIEPEEVGASGDVAEFRGMLGANLGFDDLQVAGAGDVEPERQINRGGVPQTNGQPTLGSDLKAESSIFIPFQAHGGGNTAESSGTPNNVLITRNFRDLVGRGPVLDQTDNISVVARLICEDANAGANAQIQAHLVYDVAEVSDAGRQFSLPNGD